MITRIVLIGLILLGLSGCQRSRELRRQKQEIRQWFKAAGEARNKAHEDELEKLRKENGLE